MADIAPAMSFYFGFGFLAATSGVASPLTIITAGVAIAFLANTLSRYMQAHPSTGSFITFIGMALGPVLALTTAIVLISGYLVNIFSIMAISGGFMTMFLQNYFHDSRPGRGRSSSCLRCAAAAFLMIRGVHISVRWAGAFFIFEFTILMLVSIIALIQHAGHLTLHPFNPHYLLSGFKGLGLGFPLAVYLFIGWEAAGPHGRRDRPAAQEHTPRPVCQRRPDAGQLRAVRLRHGRGLRRERHQAHRGADPVHRGGPKELALLAFLAYIAGVTSTVGCLIAAVNSQARLMFNSGREGLLPEWLGKVSAKRGTPVNALVIFIGHRSGRLLRLGLGTAHHADRAVRRAFDAGHDPRDHRVRRGEPVAAGLLPQALSHQFTSSATSSCRSSARRRSSIRCTSSSNPVSPRRTTGFPSSPWC